MSCQGGNSGSMGVYHDDNHPDAPDLTPPEPYCDNADTWKINEHQELVYWNKDNGMVCISSSTFVSEESVVPNLFFFFFFCVD
jgi:hypothetical protein